MNSKLRSLLITQRKHYINIYTTFDAEFIKLETKNRNKTKS